jgi:predicted NAD/FAD-dependent oxidoreductase
MGYAIAKPAPETIRLLTNVGKMKRRLEGLFVIVGYKTNWSDGTGYAIAKPAPEVAF